jgi:hypothetical protein
MITILYHEFLTMPRVTRMIRRHLVADIDNTRGTLQEKGDLEIMMMTEEVLSFLVQTGGLEMQ